MPLVFTSWTQCTDSDTGQSFTLNWDADSGLPIYLHLEALRQYLYERVTKVPVYIDPVISSALRFADAGRYAACQALVGALYSIYPWYVNHQKYLASSDPARPDLESWNAGTLLAAIGDPAWLSPVTADGQALAAWGRQVYKICRLLLWANETGDVNHADRNFRTDWTYGCDVRSGFGGTWADAVNAFNAASWINEASYIASYAGLEFTPSYLMRRRVKLLLENRYPINCEFDCFLQFRRYYTWDELPFIPDFPDYHIDDLYLYSSGNMLAPSDLIEFGLFGDFSLIPDAPEPGKKYIWLTALGNSHNMFSICKFNVPGGFLFQ